MPEARRSPRRRAAMVAVLLLFPLLVCDVAEAATPAEYAAELRRLARALEAAGAETALDISRQVPAVHVVEHRGQRFEVPMTWLREALTTRGRDGAQWTAARADIVSRLEAMAGEAARLDPAATLEPAAARAALDRVFTAPEFQRMQRQSAMQRLRDRIAQALIRALDWVGAGRLASRDTAVVFAWLASLIAFAVVAAWLLRVLRDPQRRERLAVSPAPMHRQSSRAWALQARAAPDPRDAVRCAYRAAVCRLEEEGTWRADDARTPREYRRLLGEHHPRRPAVAELTGRFEAVWYGARDATDDDRRVVLSRLEELQCLPAD